MEHKEVLSARIAEILKKLNLGETLCMDELAQEFNTSKRTIQRDINQRLGFLPLKKNGNKIKLESTALGQLSKQDIKHFAQVCGIGALFPSLDSRFMTSLLSNTEQSPYLVTGNEFEHDKASIKANLTKLELAIKQHKLINFHYQSASYQSQQPVDEVSDPTSGKAYINMSAYKLINHNQVWYVAIVDENTMHAQNTSPSDDNKRIIKTFHVGKISGLFVLNDSFEPCKQTQKKIEQNNCIYFNDDKTEVVVKVSKQVAQYFQRRNILPNQHIDKELATGELLVSSHIAYDLQIIPLIKYWMPHLQVISPQAVREQVHNDVQQYLAMASME